MEATQGSRIHPLVAGAAVAVIVAAGVAVAAISGVLPGSKAEVAPPEKVVTPAHPAKPAQPKQHVAAASRESVCVSPEEASARHCITSAHSGG